MFSPVWEPFFCPVGRFPQKGFGILRLACPVILILNLKTERLRVALVGGGPLAREKVRNLYSQSTPADVFLLFESARDWHAGCARIIQKIQRDTKWEEALEEARRFFPALEVPPSPGDFPNLIRREYSIVFACPEPLPGHQTGEAPVGWKPGVRNLWRAYLRSLSGTSESVGTEQAREFFHAYEWLRRRVRRQPALLPPLINFVDQPDLCHFYSTAVTSPGKLKNFQLAARTRGGRGPGLAGAIRRHLEEDPILREMDRLAPKYFEQRRRQKSLDWESFRSRMDGKDHDNGK